MTTRSGRLLQTSNGQQHSQAASQQSAQQRPAAQRLKPVPVALSEEERQSAELEAAMLYYQELIEMQERRGEEVTEDDPLVVKL